MTTTSDSLISDTELTERVSRSDVAAFKILYQRYYKSLYYYAYTRTSDEELSSDLVQDLFVKIWEIREQLDAGKSVKSFLYTALQNGIIDQSRKARNRNLRLDDLPEQSEPENFSYEQEIAGQVKVLIDNQPEPLRTVFYMSKYEGFKNREIADILGISVKTVESRITKVLKVLRETLQRQEKS